LADLGLFSCIFASKKFRLYPQIRAVTGRVALGVILHPILHFSQKGVISGQKRRFFTFCRTYMVYSMLVSLLLTNIAQNL
jgi:hypothetical protein